MRGTVLSGDQPLPLCRPQPPGHHLGAACRRRGHPVWRSAGIGHRTRRERRGHRALRGSRSLSRAQTICSMFTSRCAEATAWADAGHEVAWAQVALPFDVPAVAATPVDALPALSRDRSPAAKLLVAGEGFACVSTAKLVASLRTGRREGIGRRRSRRSTCGGRRPTTTTTNGAISVPPFAGARPGWISWPNMWTASRCRSRDRRRSSSRVRTATMADVDEDALRASTHGDEDQ